MYLLLGNKMNDELAQLTDVQRRLVQLYVNRIYTKRKEAEESTKRKPGQGKKGHRAVPHRVEE